MTKRSKAGIHGFVLGLLALFLGSGCPYSWLGRYTGPANPGLVTVRAMTPDHAVEYLEKLSLCDVSKAQTPLPANELSRRVRPGAPPLSDATVRDAAEAPLLIRFGLVSDVHIREPEVKLFSRDASHDLDKVISTFERRPVQEAFQPHVFLATLKLFDRLQAISPFRFVINLGDTIDAGTLREAYEFMYLAKCLSVPMLSAVGNHDDSVFGNYKGELAYIREASADFYAVGNLKRFLYMNDPESPDLRELSWRLMPRPYNETCHDVSLDVNGTPECPSLAVKAASLDTYCHGFDLPNREYDRINGSGPPLTECDSYTGYYAASVPLCDGTLVQLIALDFTRHDTWGADAETDPIKLHDQMEWLQHRLQERDPVLRIVFMHHRPGDDTPLMRLLIRAAAQAPIVLFSGHTHEHHLDWHGGRTGLWEVNTGSLEEFPQWARMVEIRKRVGDPKRGVADRFLMTTRAVAPSLAFTNEAATMSQDRLAASLQDCRALADRDLWPADSTKGLPWECPALPSEPPSEGESYLDKAARCGFLGSVSDYRFNKSRVFDLFQRQPLSDIRKAANIVVDLTGQGE